MNGRKKKNEGNGTAGPVGPHQVDQHWHQRDPNREEIVKTSERRFNKTIAKIFPSLTNTNLYLQEPLQAQSGINTKIYCGTHGNPTVGGQLLSRNQQDRDTRGPQYN